MNKLLKFEITDAKIERLIDTTTALINLRIISEGQNRHNMPLSLETIKDAAERTLRGKPILATYSYWDRDLEGHKPPEDSEIIGYIIENQTFEYLDIGENKKALFAKGLLWKRYAPNQFQTLLRSEDYSKSVSMEIAINGSIDSEDGSKTITSFDFLGVALLGDKISPACPGSNAELLTFSEMKNRYEAMFAMESMKINNSKEASINSQTWNNPGRKLYNALLSKSNKIALVKEAYLLVDESKLDSAPSEALSYPHHSVKNGELVLNVKGLHAARQRAAQQGIDSGEALAHLKKHYSEIGEVFAMSNELKNFEVKEDKQLEEKVMMQEPEEAEKTKPEENEQENKQDEKEDFAVTVSNYEAKIAEYEAKMKDFEAQIAQYACGEKAFQAEIEDLKSYKNRREEEDKKFAVEKLMSDVGEYLPKEKMDEFAEEAKEVKPEEFTAFANKVQAVSFSYAKKTGKETVTDRMAVQLPQEKKDDKWGW